MSWLLDTNVLVPVPPRPISDEEFARRLAEAPEEAPGL